MWWLLILLIMFVIGVSLLRSREETGRIPKAEWILSRAKGYKLKNCVMNDSEKAFFFELQKQLPEGFHIFPKIRIADFVESISGEGSKFRNHQIIPKHVDFLICDAYFKPVLAIEVNGSSHEREDRQDSDTLKQQIFKETELPLEFVEVGSNFEAQINLLRQYYR